MKTTLKIFGNPIVLIIVGFLAFAILEQYKDIGIVLAVLGVFRLLLPKGLIRKKY